MDGILMIVALVCVGVLFFRAAGATPYYKSDAYRRQFSSARRDVLARDGYRCRMCGTTRNLHVHHIVARSRGGSNNPSNLVTLCKHHHGLMHGQRWY